MTLLFSVLLPVFLVIGFGYFTAWRGWLGPRDVDGIQRFAQNFALPVLLFQSIATVDFTASFDAGAVGAFYAGALAGFAAGYFGARLIFGRPPADCVAIGFASMFSNTLLLGVPITERAYGPQALAGNYAIVTFHSPLFYTLGITLMEFTLARGGTMSVAGVSMRALGGVLRTPLVIGILCGLGVNLAQSQGLVLPEGFWAATAMIGRAAIPAALFGLGGVLHRYRPDAELDVVALCCAASLLLHPAVTWALTTLLNTPVEGTRSAVITAAMPPGVNAYLFATMYGRAQRVAASSVLIATALSLLTAWFWLGTLP